MGYGDPSCFGGSEVVTPSIDRMAAEGLKFTTWYSAAPVCTPSRAGLLLGRLPKRTGFCGPGVMWCNSLSGIPANETTFAAALQRAGYRTQMVGKASPSPLLCLQATWGAEEAEGAETAEACARCVRAVACRAHRRAPADGPRLRPLSGPAILPGHRLHDRQHDRGPCVRRARVWQLDLGLLPRAADARRCGGAAAGPAREPDLALLVRKPALPARGRG